MIKLTKSIQDVAAPHMTLGTYGQNRSRQHNEAKINDHKNGMGETDINIGEKEHHC